MVLMVAVTFVLITITGILYADSYIVICPLYISLIIMLLQTQANRYTYLLGAVNALFYGGVDLYLGLYAMAAYSMLVSSSLQIVTFVNWSKKPYGNSTMFKKLGLKKTAFLLAGFVAAWVIMYLVFSIFDSSYLVLDNTVTLLGILSTIICALSYIEYAYLNLISLVVSSVLYLQMMQTNPGQITYFIFNIYSFTCNVLALIKIRKLYAQQNNP